MLNGYVNERDWEQACKHIAYFWGFPGKCGFAQKVYHHWESRCPRRIQGLKKKPEL